MISMQRAAFAAAVSTMAAPFRGQDIAQVAGIDARGFILGGALAVELGAGEVAHIDNLHSGAGIDVEVVEDEQQRRHHQDQAADDHRGLSRRLRLLAHLLAAALLWLGGLALGFALMFFIAYN